MVIDKTSESLETGNKQREKYFTEKFEQIDVAFQVISDKADETLSTGAFHNQADSAIFRHIPP